MYNPPPGWPDISDSHLPRTVMQVIAQDRMVSENCRYLTALLKIAAGGLDAESCIRVAREATEPR